MGVGMDEQPQKLVPLGNVIIQSFPVTQEEAEHWLELIAKSLPAEMYVKAAWIPMLPGDTN